VEKLRFKDIVPLGGMPAELPGTDFSTPRGPSGLYWEPKSGKDNPPRPMAGQPSFWAPPGAKNLPPPS